MKNNKIKLLGFASIMFSLGLTANTQAASNEDYANQGSACMVLVDDANSMKYINTQYIRLIYISKNEPNILRISMASNYSNSQSYFNIGYTNQDEALKAMEQLNNSINDCSYNAHEKRKNKP